MQLSLINSAITNRQSLTGPPHNRPYAAAKNWGSFKTAALNPSDPHWVLAGSLLHSLVSQQLGVIAEGSLLNKVFPSKKGITTSFDWVCSVGPNAMVYLPCHSQTSPICAKTYGQNTRNKSPATSPNPPSTISKKPSKVPSSIAKTNNLPHCASTARVSTTNPSNKHFKILPSSNRYPKIQLPLSHH